MKISKQIAMQGLKQLFCIPYIYVSHGFKLPPENHCSKVRYQLPFEGKWTVVNGGCEREFSHSWEVPTQRYAYDFLQMDDDGRTYQGACEEPASYACYGKHIVAPADGVVVAIGKGCGDEKPFCEGKMEVMANDMRGNYILIKHAEKEYGFIGHIQPQSIVVAVGQSVAQGQKLAQCGNSGNTSEPHIHFHLQDGIGFFTSAGIPIAFQNITVSRKKGYEKYDVRAVPELQMSIPKEIRIGRGYEVSNVLG